MKLKITDTIEPKAEKILLEGLKAHSKEHKEFSPIQEFSVMLEDEKAHVFGGITGISYYGCLYVDLLWIHSDFRGQGWGRKLMEAAEELGKQRNCLIATVNTMEWEALDFYQKIGYEIEFARAGLEHNSKMYFLRKQL